MDVDRFLATNEPAWDRLAQLTAAARRGPERLGAAELDELVRLYQRTSAHLVHARTWHRDPALVAHLTGLVAAAGHVVYGSQPRTFRSAARFATDTFPAAVWSLRRFIGASAVLFLAPALALGIWLATSPAAVEATAPEAVREAYVERDFEEYYSSEPAAQFATQVFTNNVLVAVTAFAGGVLVCVPTGLVLALNGANLGVAAGLFHAAGAAPLFWGLIAPHGLLELTAVVVAGGAGLRLGWTIVDPGDRPRRAALAEEGRRSVVVLWGLVAAFLVAGVIEGFVTGSPLPTAARVTIGVAAEVAFVGWVLVRGPVAVDQSRPIAFTSR